MERSREIARTVYHFYEAIEQGTHEAFDGIVSPDPVAMVIGTDRWLGERGTWREAFPSLRGISVEDRNAQGFRHGGSGWAVDRPVFVLPEGDRLPTRLTAVVHEEEDRWKIVHVHLSVQVPDEVAVAEARGWQAATTP